MNGICICGDDYVCRPCLDHYRETESRDLLSAASTHREIAGSQFARGHLSFAFNSLERAAVFDAKWRSLNGFTFDADDAFGFMVSYGEGW
jgi:hypothetical protein